MIMNRVTLFPSATSTSSSLVKRLPTYRLIQKYSKEQGQERKDEHVLDKVRAPSTAEIMDEMTQEQEEGFRRTLEEKSQHGFVSQTSEKVVDAAAEAVRGNTDPEDVKEKFKP